MHVFPHFTPISCFPWTSDWLTLSFGFLLIGQMWISVDFGFMASTNHKTAIKEKHLSVASNFFHVYFENFTNLYLSVSVNLFQIIYFIHKTTEYVFLGVPTNTMLILKLVHFRQWLLWICGWEKPRTGKSDDYRDVIVFEKLLFQNVFRPH